MATISMGSSLIGPIDVPIWVYVLAAGISVLSSILVLGGIEGMNDRTKNKKVAYAAAVVAFCIVAIIMIVSGE